MQIIVASKYNVPHGKKENKLLQLSYVVLILAMIVLAFYSKLYILLLLVIPFIALLWRDQRRTDYGNQFFIAFMENDLLYFDFEETQYGANHAERYSYPLCKLQIAPKAIVSYRLHSFFDQQPEFLEVSFTGDDGIYTTRPIPIFYLDKAQQKRLLDFLDKLIANPNAPEILKLNS